MMVGPGIADLVDLGFLARQTIYAGRQIFPVFQSSMVIMTSLRSPPSCPLRHCG